MVLRCLPARTEPTPPDPSRASDRERPSRSADPSPGCADEGRVRIRTCIAKPLHGARRQDLAVATLVSRGESRPRDPASLFLTTPVLNRGSAERTLPVVTAAADYAARSRRRSRPGVARRACVVAAPEEASSRRGSVFRSSLREVANESRQVERERERARRRPRARARARTQEMKDSFELAPPASPECFPSGFSGHVATAVPAASTPETCHKY